MICVLCQINDDIVVIIQCEVKMNDNYGEQVGPCHVPHCPTSVHKTRRTSMYIEQACNTQTRSVCPLPQCTCTVFTVQLVRRNVFLIYSRMECTLKNANHREGTQHAYALQTSKAGHYCMLVVYGLYIHPELWRGAV